jgi:hypothetical protein
MKDIGSSATPMMKSSSVMKGEIEIRAASYLSV